MERLERKKINGRTYYYYSEWAWVDGKCRRVAQKYLGKLEDIAKTMETGSTGPLYAEVFQWGLPSALWAECLLAEVVKETDRLCPKRDQSLSTGEYVAIAAINRAICPRSKRSIWDWFSQTVLHRHVSNASKAALAAQRFWDHMDKIDSNTASSIWKNILQGVSRHEAIDLSSVSYDGTNFYTFIDTFNTRCALAKRGKNKQGRHNLRQVSYALFCSADGHMPLFYDVYEGQRNDARQFPLMLEKFHGFLKTLSGLECPPPETTLIFDKGNNSKTNFALLDSLGLNFVGSVKLDEHKDLAGVSNKDAAFISCEGAALKGTKAFRVKKKVYGKERVVVVSHNQNLFNAQWRTLQNDLAKALEKLGLLRHRLDDRARGVLKGGKSPTTESVAKQCKAILRRRHMKRVITLAISEGPEDIPRLDYGIDADALYELCNTRLGKTLLISTRESWDDAKIIKAYRSQFIIEDVFKEMKERSAGSWWPLYHWTDSKIKVHALYCTIGLLLRALLLRRVRAGGIDLSMKRLISELDAIREVVNIYPRKRRRKIKPKRSVLTKTSELQDQLITILGLGKEEYGVLG
jgi:transposase